MLALLPWNDVPVPSGVEVLQPPAGGDVGPRAAEVVFYAPPLTFELAPLELMARLPALRIVQTLTAGYEHVLPFLPPGVTLCAGGDIHAASVAELAVGLILAAQRGLTDFWRAQQQQRWSHSARPSLADRGVLIVGRGSIGRALAARLSTFECRVTLIGRTRREDSPGVAELPRLLPSADIVVLAVPLTRETAGLANREFLARMPDGALLVNVARGGVVNTTALLDELVNQRLRAALDVTDPEPLPPDHPLWAAPNALITPHVGGNSSAFEPRARRLLADQLARWAADRPLHHVVSLPVPEAVPS